MQQTSSDVYSQHYRYVSQLRPTLGESLMEGQEQLASFLSEYQRLVEDWGVCLTSVRGRFTWHQALDSEFNDQLASMHQDGMRTLVRDHDHNDRARVLQSLGEDHEFCHGYLGHELYPLPDKPHPAWKYLSAPEFLQCIAAYFRAHPGEYEPYGPPSFYLGYHASYLERFPDLTVDNGYSDGILFYRRPLVVSIVEPSVPPQVKSYSIYVEVHETIERYSFTPYLSKKKYVDEEGQSIHVPPSMRANVIVELLGSRIPVTPDQYFRDWFDDKQSGRSVPHMSATVRLIDDDDGSLYCQFKIFDITPIDLTAAGFTESKDPHSIRYESVSTI